MGGYGSGRHLKRETVKGERESMPSLCTTSWKREGLLQANHERRGVWEWTTSDIFHPHRQSIAYEIETGETEGMLRLSYSYKGEPVEYDIPLLTRLEHFGGRRWYWGCPIVGHESRSPYQRATRLYRHGKYFGCTHCLRLCYKSQNNGKSLKRWSRRFSVDLVGLESSMAQRSGWLKGCWVGKPGEKELTVAEITETLSP